MPDVTRLPGVVDFKGTTIRWFPQAERRATPAIVRRLFSTAAKYAGEASDCLICGAAAPGTGKPLRQARTAGKPSSGRRGPNRAETARSLFFGEGACRTRSRPGSELSLLDCGRRRWLRPPLKRGSARLCQRVDSPLDGDEPPIDISAQDLGGV